MSYRTYCAVCRRRTTTVGRTSASGGARFCASCGGTFQSTCRRCARVVPEQSSVPAAFCPFCGEAGVRPGVERISPERRAGYAALAAASAWGLYLAVCRPGSVPWNGWHRAVDVAVHAAVRIGGPEIIPAAHTVGSAITTGLAWFLGAGFLVVPVLMLLALLIGTAATHAWVEWDWDHPLVELASNLPELLDKGLNAAGLITDSGPSPREAYGRVIGYAERVNAEMRRERAALRRERERKQEPAGGQVHEPEELPSLLLQVEHDLGPEAEAVVALSGSKAGAVRNSSG